MESEANLAELLGRMRLLAVDHEPDGWPCVKMKDITALWMPWCRRIAASGICWPTPKPLQTLWTATRTTAEKTTPAPSSIAPPAAAKRALSQDGYDALSTWFCLSYSSFLTMPRVLMEAMPDRWQGEMAALLNEYSDTFTNWPDGMGSRVQITQDGKLVKTPEWMLNYRHPDRDAINALRG